MTNQYILSLRRQQWAIEYSDFVLLYLSYVCRFLSGRNCLELLQAALTHQYFAFLLQLRKLRRL